MKLCLALGLLLISCLSFAQEGISPYKEVFLKGSMDGKSLVMVLGFDKARDINSKIFDATFDKDNVVELGKLVNNASHDDDFSGEVREGAQVTKKHFRKILASPWKSLSKIPRRFKVNLRNAQENYYTAGSTAQGAVEYAGIGVWAVLESSYYLVIESPVAMAGNLVITSLAIPFKITVQIGRVLIKTLKNILYPIGGAIAIAGVTTYSVLSTGVVELALVVNDGLSVIGQGAQYVFSDLPKKISYPVSLVKLLDVDLKHQAAIYQMVKERLLRQGILEGETIDSELDIRKESKFKSVFTAFVKGPKGLVSAYRIKLVTKRKKVQITIDMTKRYFNSLKEKSQLTKRDLKSDVKASLGIFVADIESMI